MGVASSSMRALLVLGFAMYTSCSSSSNGSTGSGTGSDAGDGGGASSVITCGKGSVTVTGRIVDPQTAMGVPNAAISSVGCTSGATDYRGDFTVKSDLGLVLEPYISANGYISEHAEWALASANFQATAPLYEASFESDLPGWSSSQGYFFVAVAHDTSDAGPCSTSDGVTVSIKGHPEIKASYADTSTSISPTLTSTGTVGLAALGPIPPGTYEVDGTKTGCTVAPLSNTEFQFQTTNAVKANTATVQYLQLSP
jgi:hypothetical protein